MYICLCKAITSGMIDMAIQEGASSVKDVVNKTGACTNCCKCACAIKSMLPSKDKPA